MIEYERIREVAGRSIQSLYPPDKRHKGIVCPLCGNGQGKDGDGVTFVRGSNVILKCFRCGFSGDVIKLTAQANNISYREAADILAGKLGLTEEKYKNNQNRQVAPFKIPKFEHAKEIEPEEKIDQTEYFKKVEKSLSKTDYPARRGLSEDTCRHFHLGYDPIWRHPKVPKAPVSPRLIIPTSKYSYLARDVRENLSDDQKRYSKQKFGSVALFNPEALEYEFVFVTEGEIDAISFYEVCRGNALALGSVSNIQKLADYLRTATSKPKFMIAALDNDQAGQDGNLKLKQALKEFDIETLIADFMYTDLENDVQYKDANEILVKNREAFIENIELLREIPLEYYSSDKPASKILEEIGMIEDNGDEFEPYSDEELSQLIKKPEFTEENLRSMFENENLTSEEMDILISKDDSKTQERNKLLDKLKTGDGDFSDYLTSDGKHIRNDLIPKPTDAVKKRLEEAKDYLVSLTEYPVHVIYSSKFLREWAYCYLFDQAYFFHYSGNFDNTWKDNCDDLDMARLYGMVLYHAYLTVKEINASSQNSSPEEEVTISNEKISSPSPTDSTQNEVAAHSADLHPVQEEKTVAQIDSHQPIESPQISVHEEKSLKNSTDFKSASIQEKVETVSSASQPVSASATNSSPTEIVTNSNDSTSTPAQEELSSQVNSQSTSTVASDSTQISAQEKARNLIKSVTEFTNENIFSNEVLQAAAYCKVYFPMDFITFVENCRKNKIKITLLNEYIIQVARPLAKEKRHEDKLKEQARLAEESKKKHEEFKIICHNNGIRMSKLLEQPQSPERDQKIIELIQNSLERDHRGNVKSTSVSNFELALNFDPLIRGCIGYDSFAQKIVSRRKLPWTDDLSCQTVWSNYDDAGLQNYLNRTYDLNNERIFFNVISEYARKNSFHPVRDFFKRLPKWDGISRAAEFFIENLEIEDSKYTREIIKSWMMAAVARIFHPGCKWDYTLIIKGVQGIGKSTVFSKLAGQWFNDSIDNIGVKEPMENLLGSWIVELCEMQAARKADNEVIEAFLSRRADRFHVPYGRRTEEFLRQCVFAATTNDEEFLKDSIGNRRFFVLVSKAKEEFCKKQMSKFDSEYMKKIWAEIFFYYNRLFDNDKLFDSDKLLPSDETLKKAEEVRLDYTEGSALEGMIDAYLNIKLPDPKIWEQKGKLERREYVQQYSPSDFPQEKTFQRQIVTAVEIAYELLQIDNPSKEKATLKEINRILSRKMGWFRTTWKNLGVYGQQRIVFQKQFDADTIAT